MATDWMSGIEALLESALNSNPYTSIATGVVSSVLGGTKKTGKKKTLYSKIKKSCYKKSKYALQSGSPKRAIKWYRAAHRITG